MKIYYNSMKSQIDACYIGQEEYNKLQNTFYIINGKTRECDKWFDCSANGICTDPDVAKNLPEDVQYS